MHKKLNGGACGMPNRATTKPVLQMSTKTHGMAAARSAGLRYVHLPFDPQSPDPMLIDNFIAAVTAPENQPAYIHCAAGGRAAALWMIKRWKADGWDEKPALDEAIALGLNERFQPFALDYIRTHTR